MFTGGLINLEHDAINFEKPPKETNTVVELDLLGFDMLYRELYGVMTPIPVLNRKRWAKAAVYDKLLH